MFQYTYNTIVGKIFIAEENNAITHISFTPVNGIKSETSLIKQAKNELDEYFKGKRKTFDLPLAPKGTEFQLKVWEALKNIRYGNTASYKDIAIAVGNEKACRAVGMANNKNPICIVIPCHRVIGSNDSLVGYSGGLDIKEKLLKIENII